MEIKEGDKVRVSVDTPRMYIYPDSPGGRYCECMVKDTDGDNAYIEPKELEYFPFTSIIPLKYLIKVEDEAKEPKFKVGDRVRIVSLHGRPIPGGGVDVIAHINIGNEKQMYFLENHYGCAYGFSESDLEPYAEPTEAISQEEALNEYDPAAHNVTPAIAYYDAYTADLAKEIALKVANKFNDPKELAEYAVNVAKAVTEGLKKK